MSLTKKNNKGIDNEWVKQKTKQKEKERQTDRQKEQASLKLSTKIGLTWHTAFYWQISQLFS